MEKENAFNDKACQVLYEFCEFMQYDNPIYQHDCGFNYALEIVMQKIKNLDKNLSLKKSD